MVFIILSAGLEQLAQLLTEELQPLDQMVHIGLLVEGTVAVGIFRKKSGDNGFTILQQRNGQVEDVAGCIQCLYIMSGMIPEQIAESLDRALQNIGIIFLKGSGEIVFEQTDIKGIFGIFPRMIGIKCNNGFSGLRILEDLSCILVRVADRTRGLYRQTDVVLMLCKISVRCSI